MKNVIPLKDKKISHHDCNDGAGQGGGSAGRRRMSLIKINHLFSVNDDEPKKKKKNQCPKN